MQSFIVPVNWHQFLLPWKSAIRIQFHFRWNKEKLKIQEQIASVGIR